MCQKEFLSECRKIKLVLCQFALVQTTDCKSPRAPWSYFFRGVLSGLGHNHRLSLAGGVELPVRDLVELGCGRLSC